MDTLAVLYYELYRIHARRDIFENLVSLITSQQVKFEKGRRIRKTLYELVNGVITPTTIKLTSIDELCATGLTRPRAIAIKRLADVHVQNDDELMNEVSRIPGIASWTLKGAQLLTYDPTLVRNIALYEDMWIRKRLGEYKKQMFPLSLKASKEMFATFQNPSLVSYFLWRIQPSGIQKILRNELLLRTDFV